jgi:hypothetical protein
MKLADVVVGELYWNTVGRGMQRLVRVVEVKQVPPNPWLGGTRWTTIILAVVEGSNRRVMISSASRLRPTGCEFCRATFNRPDEPFECPYCATPWEPNRYSHEQEKEA